jgi:RNase P/RNase MRP subunit POP5
MRTYKPSHRPDFRYISIENPSGVDIGKYLLEFFGICCSGKLRLRNMGKAGSEELIRVERGMARQVAAALLASRRRIFVKGITGTVAKATGKRGAKKR